MAFPLLGCQDKAEAWQGKKSRKGTQRRVSSELLRDRVTSDSSLALEKDGLIFMPLNGSRKEGRTDSPLSLILFSASHALRFFPYTLSKIVLRQSVE